MVPSPGLPFWYCCLAEPERTAIDTLCTHGVSTFWAPYPRASWELLWSAAPWGSVQRRQAAEAAWRMYDTEIEVPGLPPIPAVQLAVLGPWMALALFVVVPGDKCADGCTQPNWA